MKNIFLILLLFSLYVNGQNNNLFIEYEYSYVNDSLNPAVNKSESMILKTNNNGFVFLSLNDYIMDTIQGDINDLSKYMVDGVLDVNQTLSKFGGKTDNIIRLFYENKNINYFIQTNIALTKVDFEDQVPYIQWDLVNEEKKILGYKAKKATTTLFGRQWEAWYTEEIPLAYGPYKFNGLPGLIIEITDNQYFFKYNLKNIKQDNHPQPKVLDYNRIKMSRSEFMDYIKKYKENPLIVLGNRNSVLRDDESFFKRKKEQLESNNNSIERGLQFNLK